MFGTVQHVCWFPILSAKLAKTGHGPESFWRGHAGAELPNSIYLPKKVTRCLYQATKLSISQFWKRVAFAWFADRSRNKRA